MVGFFEIDSHDIYTKYGLMAVDGVYAQLLKLPRRVFFTHDWGDQHGLQRYMDIIKTKSREITLDFTIEGTNDVDFMQKYGALKSFFKVTTEFDFAALKMDRLFKLKYRSMPNFEKLNIMRENGKVYASFSIVVRDDYPLLFLHANGNPITLTAPVDVADAPIDFSLVDFQLIDGNLYVINSTEPKVIKDTYLINGNEVRAIYGLMAMEGLYNDFLKYPEMKPDSNLKMQTRTITMPFVIEANSKSDFYVKWYRLAAFLLNSKYFNFDIANLNKRYSVCYSEMTDFEKLSIIEHNGKVYASVNIVVFDDFPATETSAGIYDARLWVDENGNIQFYQSPEFNAKIDFQINADGELLVIKL